MGIRRLHRLVVLLVLGQSVLVFGISDERLREMQEQAKKEGWKYTVGRNLATELSLGKCCGALPVDPNDLLFTKDFGGGTLPGGLDSLPAAWDWREYGVVPPIRFQGDCGSCWIFSAVSVVESAILIAADGKLNSNEMDLSEQWLVSCTGWCDGCHAGDPPEAFCRMEWDPRGVQHKDIYNHCGAVLEVDFPYVAEEVPCEGPFRHAYGIESQGWVGTTTEQVKQGILTYGQVTARINVYESFEAYNGGIYDEHWGDYICAHWVTLVGWDDNPPEQPEGPGVWILRNSWATSWGENGYMRIEYDMPDLTAGGHAPHYIWDKDPFEAHWKFDEGSGSDAYDSVGDNHGQLAADPADPSWIAGVSGEPGDYALYFDGDDFVELPDAVAIRDQYAKSISAWIRIDEWEDYANVVSWNVSQNGIERWTLVGLYTGGRITGGLNGTECGDYRCLDPRPRTQVVTIDPVCSTGQWYHVCFTYDGLDTSIYVDGFKEATEVEEREWAADEGVHIGKGFKGTIDDVHVYNWVPETLFRVQDASSLTVATFDSLGNLFLKGGFTSGGIPSVPPGSFIVANSTETVAYIDNEGNLWTKGQRKSWVNPSDLNDEFIVETVQIDQSIPVAYINESGDLYLKGELYQNPEP